MRDNTAKVIRNNDGVYLFDTYGKKYIDFSSQAVCSNLGHTLPEEVRQSINEQMDKVSFLYGGLAISEIRARLSKLLADICPGDINGFLFPSSGSEANEAAIRVARKYTGCALSINNVYLSLVMCCWYSHFYDVLFCFL